MVTSNAKHGRSQNDPKNSYSLPNKEMEVEHELFLEKLEAKKRLEREIKIKKKRIIKDHTQKEKKPQEKHKRMKNIDWTKGYEYGLFDDDEYYDHYMK